MFNTLNITMFFGNSSRVHLNGNVHLNTKGKYTHLKT